MSLDLTATNVVVDGNTFENGIFTPDSNIGSTPVTYGYYSCIRTYTSATITNNRISGILNASGAMIIIGSGSCLISDNTFIRGASSIPSYVEADSSFDQVIMNNVFDSPTVDGTIDTLVTFLSSTSTYQQNKNQTGYMSIPKVNYLIDQQIWDPPMLQWGDFVKYTDNGIFNVDPELPEGLGEGIAASYAVDFIKYGDPLNGGLFNVQYGSNIVNCSFTVSGVIGPKGLFVRFAEDDDFYYVYDATITGSTVTQLILGNPSNPFPAAIIPVNYTGQSASPGIYGRFYDGPGTPLANIGPPSSTTVSFSFLMDLNVILPSNVQILSTAIGIYGLIIGNLSGGTYDCQLFASVPSNYSLAALPGSPADPTAVVPATTAAESTITIGTGAGQIHPAAFSTTQFLTMDLTNPSTISPSDAALLVTGKNRKLPFTYQAEIIIDSGTETLMWESPLVVKFRW